MAWGVEAASVDGGGFVRGGGMPGRGDGLGCELKGDGVLDWAGYPAEASRTGTASTGPDPKIPDRRQVMTAGKFW
jgi:hypothetical protein